MKTENLKLKIALISALLLILLAGLFSYEYFRFNDGKLHIVFCNVGQGDGIFIRTPKGLDILVDGGPDNSVLSCLSSHMPFWDRTIELMFLSHPHADHMRGLLDVLKRYEVQSFSTEKIENDTVLYRELINQVKSSKLKVQSLYAGDMFTTKDGVTFRILHPTENFLKASAPTGLINESSELASLIIHVSYKDTDIILTGDSEILGLKEALRLAQGKLTIEVLQVPHHGSRFGLDSEIVQKLNPKLAVISVGKNNYGHPSKEVIEILEDSDIKILRTDLNGEIYLKF